MAKTHKNTWKQRERDAAAIFGSLRKPLSGGSGREDQTRSDSVHPTLFIETKLRPRHAARTLHDETRARAHKEGKVPVVCLADKGRPGFLVCVHSDDLTIVAIEYLSRNGYSIAFRTPLRELDDMAGRLAEGA